MRRLVFAVPFVVTVSCDRPVEPHRHARPPVAAPADAAVDAVDAFTPDARIRRLVGELPPLARYRTIVCEDRPCNPPPPQVVKKPDEVTQIDLDVDVLARDPGGTRVRVTRKGQAARDWRAVFVDANGKEVPDSECVFADEGYEEMDCVTPRRAEEIVSPHGVPLKLRVIPPTRLVERIERERADWVDLPADAPLGAVIVRVIKNEVVGADLVLALGRGRNDDIDVKWHGVTLKPRVPCAIISVSRTVTICRAHLTIDQIRESPYVMLAPP